ncbi:hypothetical protein RRG08_042966 [Elysia crispata]|uniref:Uncharacterized protein n=1 Tax=Elysia crispata TaxID=231223 RepID=A0AAE1B022_9GAST|nr:hypothetical protein RRG08_042966 [Elysia crispata]
MHPQVLAQEIRTQDQSFRRRRSPTVPASPVERSEVGFTDVGRHLTLIVTIFRLKDRTFLDVRYRKSSSGRLEFRFHRDPLLHSHPQRQQLLQVLSPEDGDESPDTVGESGRDSSTYGTRRLARHGQLLEVTGPVSRVSREDEWRAPGRRNATHPSFVCILSQSLSMNIGNFSSIWVPAALCGLFAPVLMALDLTVMSSLRDPKSAVTGRDVRCVLLPVTCTAHKKIHSHCVPRSAYITDVELDVDCVVHCSIAWIVQVRVTLCLHGILHPSAQDVELDVDCVVHCSTAWIVQVRVTLCLHDIRQV